MTDYSSQYFLLSNYSWYNNLSLKLYEYTGKYKSLLQKAYYFKLFNCKSCVVFWLSLIAYFALSYFTVIDYTIYALITFLIHKSQQDV